MDVSDSLRLREVLNERLSNLLNQHPNDALAGRLASTDPVT